MTTAATSARLIAAIHAAKAKAGLDDDAYRDMLAAQTGKRSAKDLTAAELRLVLAHLNGSQPTFRKSSRADVRKIFALWGEAKRRGILDNPSKAGLRAFCGRMAASKSVVSDPEFLTPAQARSVIEALKAMIERG